VARVVIAIGSLSLMGRRLRMIALLRHLLAGRLGLLRIGRWRGHQRIHL